MNCPIDKTEMEEGFLSTTIVWKKGKPWMKPAPLGLYGKGTKWMKAYRCPKCEQVVLSTKEE